MAPGGMKNDRDRTRTKLWAPKTRTGCFTCKSRRVKCDETRPRCNRCEKGHFVCQGYPTKPAVQQSSAAPLAPKLTASPPSNHTGAFQDIRQAICMAPRVALLLEELSRMELYHNELNMGYIGSVMSYLTHLPIRVDQDPTLDLAIHCVAFTLKGFIEHDFTEAKFEMTDTKLLVAYCQALNGLQRALQDPQRSKSATVLCITKLLMLFECLRGTTRVEDLVRHERGASLLIQHRGPSRFTTEFEKCLLATHVPLIFNSTFFTSQICFLGEPEWMAAVKGCVSSAPQSVDRADFWLMYYTHAIPFANNLVKISRLITFPPACSETRALQQKVLVEETLKLYETIESWHTFIINAEPTGKMRALWHVRWLNRVQITVVAMILQCHAVVAIGAGDIQAVYNHALRLTDSLILANKTRTSVSKAEYQFVTGVCRLVKMTKNEWVEFVVQAPQLDESGNEVQKLMSSDMYWRFFRACGCIPLTEP